MKINFMRFMLSVLHTMNGFALGVFLIQKDYLIAVGSLAIFLILWVNDYDLYIKKPKEDKTE